MKYLLRRESIGNGVIASVYPSVRRLLFPSHTIPEASGPRAPGETTQKMNVPLLHHPSQSIERRMN